MVMTAPSFDELSAHGFLERAITWPSQQASMIFSLNAFFSYAACI
jgi:hypothetical protein